MRRGYKSGSKDQPREKGGEDYFGVYFALFAESLVKMAAPPQKKIDSRATLYFCPEMKMSLGILLRLK